MDLRDHSNGSMDNGMQGKVPAPTNPMVSPLLTDLYQFTMSYAYWKAGKNLERAVFDLFFCRNLFRGEYTVFGGLDEWIRLIANFRFSEEEIQFLRRALPTCEYYYFIRLMGRTTSHVALECTLQSYPNMTILGEEISLSKLTLFDITKRICDAVQARAEQDKCHGVIPIPESP